MEAPAPARCGTRLSDRSTHSRLSPGGDFAAVSQFGALRYVDVPFASALGRLAAWQCMRAEAPSFRRRSRRGRVDSWFFGAAPWVRREILLL
jgi:hypothetical protein